VTLPNQLDRGRIEAGRTCTVLPSACVRIVARTRLVFQYLLTFAGDVAHGPHRSGRRDRTAYPSRRKSINRPSRCSKQASGPALRTASAAPRLGWRMQQFLHLFGNGRITVNALVGFPGQSLAFDASFATNKPDDKRHRWRG